MIGVQEKEEAIAVLEAILSAIRADDKWVTTSVIRSRMGFIRGGKLLVNEIDSLFDLVLMLRAGILLTISDIRWILFEMGNNDFEVNRRENNGL